MFQVYKNTSNVDDYLVESITRPAADPNAGEVYYRYRYIYTHALLGFETKIFFHLLMD